MKKIAKTLNNICLVFLSEVDHNKYQNVKQKYKFELLEGEE